MGKEGYDKEAENAENTKATEGGEESRVSICWPVPTLVPTQWLPFRLRMMHAGAALRHRQGGEVHIVSFNPWKSRAVPELSSLPPLVLEDELWLLPCSGCERTDFLHTSVVKGCLFYSFFTPQNWQDSALLSRMSVWN